MSTYLELVNDVLVELNEVVLTDTTFPSARGIHRMAKNAVRDTVKQINTQKFEWPFNKADGTQILTAGTLEYSWPSDLKVPDWQSFYVENDGTLTTKTCNIKQIAKEDYWKYLRPKDIDAGAEGREIPYYVSETSGGGFAVSPSPDAAYTVKYTYFINTVNLVAHDDVCTIPELYNYVILRGALEHMYLFMDNGERNALSGQSFKNMLNDMAYILIPKSPDVTAGAVNTGQPYYTDGFYFGQGEW